MDDVDSAQRPRGAPSRGRGAEAFEVSPFARLARVHLLSAGGDALIAIALAGSLFFNLEPDAARPRVALYLLVTIAPFALVGPLIGPLIDRAKGGRRAMMIFTGAGRCIVALLMMRHLDSLLLFPEAFASMVLGKTYHVSKSALVPHVVRANTGLIEANSRLVLLSGLGGAIAIGPGLLLGLMGETWTLGLAAIVFGFMVPAAIRLPAIVVAEAPVDDRERSELRGANILLAASAMSVLRGMTGFTLFLIAFWLRESNVSPAWFGAMFVASSIGSLCGALLAPFARRVVREEYLLGLVLAVAALVGIIVAVSADRPTVAAFAFVVGLAASLGKLSFDAIVQRDAPDANQGRSFAKFETRFQLTWVLGALVPVVAPNGILPIQAGLVILSVAAAMACFLYLGGIAAVARGRRTPSQVIASRVWTEARHARVTEKLPPRVGRMVPRPLAEPILPQYQIEPHPDGDHDVD
ncbi:MAG: hypothetical protein ACI91O_001563 [Candidatus Poriferisodalaceae bacterium]